MSVVVSIFHHELFDALPLDLKFWGKNRKMANEKKYDFNRLKAKSRIEKKQSPIIDAHNINCILKCFPMNFMVSLA